MRRCIRISHECARVRRACWSPCGVGVDVTAQTDVSGGAVSWQKLLPSGCQDWNAKVLGAGAGKFAYCSTLAVYVYNLETFMLESVLTGHQQVITGLSWCVDCTRPVTTAAAAPVHTLHGVPIRVPCLHGCCFCACVHRGVLRWHVLRHLPYPCAAPGVVALGFRRAYSLSFALTFHIHPLAAATCVTAPSASLCRRCPHASSRLLFVTVSDDLKGIVWDSRTGKSVMSCTFASYPVHVEWSPFDENEIGVTLSQKRSATPACECMCLVARVLASDHSSTCASTRVCTCLLTPCRLSCSPRLRGCGA
jgi:WD40 repeat protein